MQTDSLGDRMKRYEAASDIRLTPRSCVILRADGRAFHTFTRGLQPFSPELRDSMVWAGADAAVEMAGFKIGYHQSDELSFLVHDFEHLYTEPWFGYKLQKLVSVTASEVTSAFNRQFGSRKRESAFRWASFDCRAFVVPKEDAANYFLWRVRDWERNSIQMYARQFFTHSQLHLKNTADIHEMLHGIGKNWTTDLKGWEKNGTFFRPYVFVDNIPPRYDAVAALISPMLEPAREECDTVLTCTQKTGSVET